MFGTVLINQKTLDKRYLQGYRAAYCGLCRSLNKLYGKTGEKTLSYDLTFLVLLLESVVIEGIKVEQCHCTMHPFRKVSYFVDEYCDYAADMNYYLAYLKAVDDIQDEGLSKAVKLKNKMLEGINLIHEKYPDKMRRIDEYMLRLSNYEKEQEIDPELPTDCFGKVLEEVFDYPCAYNQEFKKIGYHLGRFVYLVDAMIDFEDDLRRELYNPLVMVMKEDYRSILENEVVQIQNILKGVPLVHHKEIMDNILYSGLWTKFDVKFGGGNR